MFYRHKKIYTHICILAEILKITLKPAQHEQYVSTWGERMYKSHIHKKHEFHMSHVIIIHMWHACDIFFFPFLSFLT